uniref:Uncharacterized protein n=1 Tax=Ignisphaera aggregans TaxID=334771 RepID=A0A7C2ZC97_9CREN
MPRLHYIVENSDLAKVVSAANTLLKIEDAIEEVVSERDIELRGYNIEGIDLSAPRKNSYVVYIDTEHNCRDEITIEDLVVKVVCKRGVASNSSIYRALAADLTRISINILAKYIAKDEEFMVLILDKGIAAVLEGMPEKVVAPYIAGTLFICHTHPNTVASAFSKEDALTLLDVMSRRGFGGCVVSRLNSLTMYRAGLFVLEDYFKIFNAANDLEHLDGETIKSLGLRTVDCFNLSI